MIAGRHWRMGFCALAWLGAAMPGGPALQESPGAVRLAVVVPRQASDALRKLLPLVEDRLGRQSGIELLDRANLDRVLAEHQVDLTTSAATLEDRCRLGALLNADVLLFLDSRQEAAGDVYVVKTADVRTGLQLCTAGIAPGVLSFEESCEQVVFCVERALARRRQPMRAILAAFPFVSNDLGDKHDEDARRYQVMVEQIANAVPGCYAVAMAEAREIMEEKGVALRLASAVQHPYPVFVRGTYRNDGEGDDRRVTMTVEFQTQDARRAGKAFVVRPESVLESIRAAVRECITSLGTTGGGDSSATGWAAEAAEFWRQAHAFRALGQTRESLTCLQTALILLPEDAMATSNRFEDIVVPRSPVAERTGLRDAVKTEILRTYAAISVWEYADPAHDLIEELLHSTLPPSGENYSDGRCPAQTFWHGLRIACGGVLGQTETRATERLWPARRRTQLQRDQDAEARATASRHLRRMREILIGAYERRPGKDAEGMTRWHTFVKGTFPYLFTESKYYMATPNEIEGYFNDLTRAAIAFSSLPASNATVVAAMGEFAFVDPENRVDRRPFLKRIEAAVPAPDGRWLSEYGRLAWCARNAMSFDRDVLARYEAEAIALREEIQRAATPGMDVTARRKALVAGLTADVQDPLANWLRIPGRSQGSVVSNAPAPPKPIIKHPVPATVALEGPRVPPLSNELLGFTPVRIQPPKGPDIRSWEHFDGASIRSWERFDCGMDLLIVRSDHEIWRLMKLAGDDNLQLFFGEAKDDTRQQPLSVQFDSTSFHISYGDRVVICDPAGRVGTVLRCGADFPEGRLGPGICLGPGVSLWSGTTQTRRGQQAWLARADTRAGTNRVQILHEARMQQGDAGTSADIAYWPTYVVRIGPADSARVIVGRSASSRPLLADCNTHEVTVFPHTLGAFVQDDIEKNHLYWIDRGALVQFDTATLSSNAVASVAQKMQGLYYKPLRYGYNPFDTACVRASGGRVFFVSQTAEDWGAILGFCDVRSGEMHVLSVPYEASPSFGASTRHGLVLCGAPGGPLFPKRYAFWHALDFSAIELDNMKDGMIVHRFATGAPQLVVEFIEDGRRRITEYRADGGRGSIPVRTYVVEATPRTP